MSPVYLSIVLGVLGLLLSPTPCLAYTDRNVTVDDRDPSVVLLPFEDWATSDQAQGAYGGSFAFSNRENATVVFTFPGNATAVSWQGFKRTGPALYSVCLDCIDLPDAQLVDGHDSTAKSINYATTIFSTDVQPDSNRNHTLLITNLLDPRFGTSSQITVDSFIVTFSSSSWSPPPMYPAAAPASVAGNPSQTAIIQESSVKGTLSTGAIIGVALAAAIALASVVGAVWWRLRRGRRSGTAYKTIFRTADEKGVVPTKPDPESPMSSTLKVPPRNAEQASMFRPTTYSVLAPSPGRTKSYSERLQPLSAVSPLTRSTRPPSIRSASTSMLSRGPSTTSTLASSEWGTIPVVLSNPFTSPHDPADADSSATSDVDLDTPFPSSELGSTFMEKDSRLMEDMRFSPSNMRKIAVHSTGPPVVWRNEEGESDDGRTRGWRRVQA